MIFRNLDSNGDWGFGNGKSSYVSGNTAIGLNVKTRILSWVGDCFFDMKAGIDWANRLGSKNQRALLDADTRRVVLTSFGVTGLSGFASVLNRREYTATYGLNTIYSKAYISSVAQGTVTNV